LEAEYDKQAAAIAFRVPESADGPGVPGEPGEPKAKARPRK